MAVPSHGDLFSSGQTPFAQMQNWLDRQHWNRGGQSQPGLLLLSLACIPIGYLLSVLAFKWTVALFLLLIGFPLMVLCMFNLTFSLGMLLFVAVLVVFGAKYTSAPIGTLLDLLILVSALGVLLRQIKERDWRFAAYPLSYMILAWLYYNLMQVLNPWAESRLAWLFTVRSVAIQQAVFFIGAYALRDNRKGLFNLLKFIVLIAGIGAIYGLKQQFLGFSAAETNWMMADRERYQLYFQWGMMRIPSFCYDPTTFGILMACFALFCGALVAGPLRLGQRIVLSILGLLALWAMAYSGTRTAYVLIPAGAFFYGAMYFSKRVLLVGTVLGILGAGFVLKSSSNGVIYRIQSAFRPTKDDSMNLRLENQKKIQPFIQSHPFGGGLGSCGVWGKRFNPDSPLSSFPHDSSFVRMAVELGWIGLILYTLMHYVVLRTGLYYFIRCRDPFIKSVYAGITTWCFMLAVACYAQEAILQLPTNVIYNIFLAMLVSLKNFDPAFQEKPA